MTHDIPKSKVKYLTRVIDAANRYRGDSMYKDKVFESLSSKTPLDLEKVPKTDIEALYKQLFQWASSVQTAGTALKNLKKLVAKNSKEQVKKVVQGRTRLVFIDAKRRQYVKVKGVYMPISELRKT
jgi:ketopantoate reductase